MFNLTRTARALAGLALVVGGLSVTPALKAHAGTGCVTDYTGDELNPIVSQSDFLADADNSRGYADITQVCGNSAGGTADGIQEASFTFTLASPLPSFPTLAGDAGISLTACVDATGAIAFGPVQIGVGHRGGPIFDGPYPPSQGWKYCAFASLQAGSPVDYGVETFDPVGSFTFFDFPELTDPNAGNAATISAPTGLSAGSNTVTIFLPDTLVFHVNPPTPPLKGVARADSEPFINPAAGISNALAITQVQAVVSLPFPVCVNANPVGISCNGNQIVGPIQGIVGILATSDWAPGKIVCTTLGNPLTCSASAAPSGQANNLDLGILPIPFEAQAVETCANPLRPGPPTPPVNNGLVTCTAIAGTYSYNPCQTTSSSTGQDQGDLTIVTGSCPVAVPPVTLAYEYDSEYGRITPDQLPLVDGFDIGPVFKFTSAGWNF